MLPNDNEDDILMCGKCHNYFALKDIIQFLDHKKYYCNDCDNNTHILHCQTCSKKFNSPLRLLLHAQNAHYLKIYYEHDSLNSSTNDNEELIDCSIHKSKPLSPSTDETEFLPNSTNNFINISLDKDQLSSNHSSQQLSDVSDDAIDISYNNSSLTDKNCCSSVIPKKRNRHFETNHNYHKIYNNNVNDFKQACHPINDFLKQNKFYNEITDTVVLPERISADPIGITCKTKYAESDAISLFQNAEEPAAMQLNDENVNSIQQINLNTSYTKQKIKFEEVKTCADYPESEQGIKKRQYPTTKPFKCEQCHESFNQRIHLRKHLSKHTGIKPFKCSSCSYSTVERSHLKVHVRIHTGEKPFKCTYCDYATAQNSTLKIHLKRHHAITSKTTINTSKVCSFCKTNYTCHEAYENHKMLCAGYIEWMQNYYALAGGKHAYKYQGCRVPSLSPISQQHVVSSINMPNLYKINS